MVHIWSEDNYNSAFVQFMEFLRHNNVSIKLIGADIKGLNGNESLCDYVEQYKYNNSDEYIIFFDDVVDNIEVLEYRRRIDLICNKHKNVRRVNLICFEYLMLKFRYFIQWTNPIKEYKLYNAGRIAREDFIKCIDERLDWRISKNIVKFMSIVKNKTDQEILMSSNLSVENICTSILLAMTNGGTTEFGIVKTKLGKCWISDCCFKHTKAVGNKKCRLFKYHKTSKEKAMNLWNCTDIHKFIK